MGVGTWGVSSTTDGRKVGALPLPAADQPTLARVVDLINRVRAANLPGVLRIADLVAHQGRTWLVTVSPAAPTVATLHGRLSPGLAATIAADTGQTLLQLHAAGIVHGALDGTTVVISPAGAAQLNEVGIAAALAGRAPEAAEDVTAWAALIRQLLPGNPTLDAVAASAAAGLETALRVLAANAAPLPGFGDRQGLIALHGGIAQPIMQAAEAPPEESTTLLPQPEPEPVGPTHPVTTPQQHIPQQSSPQVQPSPSTHPMGAVPPVGATPGTPQDQATRMGQRQPSTQSTPELRFGRGVPAQPPTAPRWTPPPAPVKPKRSLAKVLSTVFSALLTVAVVVVAGLLLWDRFRPNPLVVTSVKVPDATAPNCTGFVDVVGEVTSNGTGGVFRYQWVKYDGSSAPQVLDPLEQSVEKTQTSTKVHLQWSISGRGALRDGASATLRILEPAVMESTGKVTYSCR